ncbi:MAG: tyrosine-type recombinase/integrase [Gemmatimonas sp.]|nr:tyrosine-type recombinase/integrase [Gemmatimonas sp.]
MRFAAVGGKREPLVAEGETFATTDRHEAQRLFDARWALYEVALDRLRVGLPTTVPDARGTTLAEFAITFLQRLASMRLTTGAPVHAERSMDRRKRGILTCLDTPRLQKVEYLSRLRPEDVDAMLCELSAVCKDNGEPLAAATVRSYALEFSAMLTEAVRDRLIPTNPLPESRYLPRLAKRTAVEDDKFLDRVEVRALLNNVLPSPQVPYAIELAMTLAYTGMRREEAMDLLVRDVNLEKKTIRVAPNQFSDGKTEAAERQIPLWPRLEAVLRPLLLGRPGNAVVFASAIRKHRDKVDVPHTSIMGTLRAAARRAGIRKKMDHHILRHSYVSARLQMQHPTVTGTLVSVDPQLIVSEIGHSDESLIRRVYGHITRDRDGETILNFGETLPARAEAERRRTAACGERIRMGKAARKARLAAGDTDGPPAAPLTPAEQRQRREYAGTIRTHARARGYSEDELTAVLKATPAEVTAILRGDLSRFHLSRLQRYAATVADDA